VALSWSALLSRSEVAKKALPPSKATPEEEKVAGTSPLPQDEIAQLGSAAETSRVRFSTMLRT